MLGSYLLVCENHARFLLGCRLPQPSSCSSFPPHLNMEPGYCMRGSFQQQTERDFWAWLQTWRGPWGTKSVQDHGHTAWLPARYCYLEATYLVTAELVRLAPESKACSAMGIAKRLRQVVNAEVVSCQRLRSSTTSRSSRSHSAGPMLA